jgi:hypothetical protein
MEPQKIQGVRTGKEIEKEEKVTLGTESKEVLHLSRQRAKVST